MTVAGDTQEVSSGDLVVPAAEVVEKDGQLVHRSMIYSEYFAPGTEPTTSCDLHAARGINGEVSGYGEDPVCHSPPGIPQSLDLPRNGAG